MERLVILGAGTVARYVLDVIQPMADRFSVAGIYDDRYPVCSEVLGLPVLGRMDQVPGDPDARLTIAVGEPRARKALYHRFSREHAFATLIHPSATISRAATIGEAAIIGPFCSVLSGSVIGPGALLLSHVNVNHDVRVGDFSLIGAGTVIGNGACLEEGCHISLGMRIAQRQLVEAWSYVQ